MLEEIIRKRKIKKMRGAMKTELRKGIREGNAAKNRGVGQENYKGSYAYGKSKVLRFGINGVICRPHIAKVESWLIGKLCM